MGIVFESFKLDIISMLLALAVCTIAYYKWAFAYWKKRGVYTVPPSIPLGNFGVIASRKRSLHEIIKELYDTYKKQGLKYGGAYILAQPLYIPIDQQLIKDIMQKDFSHFINHGVYINEHADPLSATLFGLEDQKWRDMRVKLTPTFTSGKMKMMFQTLVDCSIGLQSVIDAAIEKHEAIDIKDVLGRFSTDVIGSCAFGIECNSLKDPDSLFRYYGKAAIEPDLWQSIKNILSFAFPKGLLNTINFRLTRRDVEKFFTDIVKKTVQYREKNNVYRKDFMHLLLQLKNRGEVADDEKIGVGTNAVNGINMAELTAQCFVFFVAGFETSSTTNTFAMYELAKHQEIQENLREEINEVMEKHNNKLTYEGIMKMTYLDMVIKESLRKYPPVTVLPRQCNKEYRVAGTDCVIEEGTNVWIPIFGLQRDPEYFPEPEVFDPERFRDASQVAKYPYYPFGEGPRMCIGMRFGIMQAKVGLATLIRNYKFTINSKTIEPIKFDVNAGILTAEGGIWLNAQQI